MRRSVVIYVLVPALLLGAGSPGLAQDEAVLTLDQALAEALARNPVLAVERNEVDIAAGALQQARVFPFNPELEIEGSIGRGRSRESDERRGTDGKGIGLSQTIPLRGQWGLRIQAAEAGLGRATHLVQDAERNVVGDVLRAFSELGVGQQRVALAREIVALAAEVRGTAEKLLEAGAVPQLDVFRAEVELHKAQNRLVTEERNLATAQRDLALLLGRPADRPLRAEAPVTLPLPAADLAALQRLALERRPDLLAVRAAAQAAEAELALARAERFLPEVKLGLKYDEGREFDSLNRKGLLTLSIPLPVFNRRQGDVARATAEVKKQEAGIALARRRIEKEVATAYQQVLASRRITEAYSARILPDQERNFRLLREGYDLGQFSITDVFVGQREFIEAREAYLEAMATLNTAAAELYRTAGGRP